MTTTVMSVKTTDWNSIKNGYNKRVIEHDEGISMGLALRVASYAKKTCEESGFTQATTWPLEVFTMDGDLPRGNRCYGATFKNDKGGTISVVEIHINRGGWPFLDHGFEIDRG